MVYTIDDRFNREKLKRKNNRPNLPEHRIGNLFAMHESIDSIVCLKSTNYFGIIV